MGKGDSKYKAAKKKKLPFLKEEDILRYLKSSGQSIMAREGINDPAKSGLNEASFLHDVIKHSKVQTEGTSQVTSIEILLQHGADVTVVDDLGRTPLHYVVVHMTETEDTVNILNVCYDEFVQILGNYV